jgi:hypothetical protein
MTIGQILFLLMCDTSWKLESFTNLRATTLKILNIFTWKYPGAQLHMLSNIPVRFHDSMSNTLLVTWFTSWKLEIFTNLRVITLKILNISTQKYPGVQLHMQINIPVRLYDSRSNIFWVRHKLKIENFKFLPSQRQ